MLVPEDPEGLPDLFDEALSLQPVYTLDFLQERERRSQLFTDGNKSCDILWEARSAVTKSCAKKASAYSFVCPDPVGDHLHVRSGCFTYRRNRIDIRDLERQKGV